MENNKNMWIGIVVIIIIIGVALFFSLRNKKVAVDTTVAPLADNNALEPDSTLDISDIVGTSTTGVAPVSISYAEALIKYADRRIQFNKECQASPFSVTYKDNSGIMLDNRAPVSRVIKVGTNYTIKAYGFKIVVLPDIYLKSKTLLVDCDKQQNVATILVQE